MVSVDKVVAMLNHALNDADLKTNKFEAQLELLTQKEKVKVKIVDLEYYNEDRLQRAKNEKINCIRSQNFELSAKWRDKERKILEYIKLREEFNIIKSCFHLEAGYLLYFYLGTEKNDKQVKELIKVKLKN